MLTFHNDNFRTGLNPHETGLTPANVDSARFGRLFAHADQIHGLFGVAAYFKGKVYLHGSDYFGGDVLKAFDITTGLLSTTPSHQAGPKLAYGFPGATPSISANGAEDGIVWELERLANSAAVLHAYKADDLSVELYNSSQAPNGRDLAGAHVKFTPPTIARGKVYVAGVKQLTVYARRPQK